MRRLADLVEPHGLDQRPAKDSGMASLRGAAPGQLAGDVVADEIR